MYGKIENGFITISDEKRGDFKPIIDSVPLTGTGRFAEYIDKGDFIEKVYETDYNSTFVRLQDLEETVSNIVEKVGLTDVKNKFKKDKIKK